MIEINRNSWHYKFIDRWNDRYPKDNLCDYFWQLISTFVVFSRIVLVITLFVLAAIINPLFVVYNYVFINQYSDQSSLICVLGVTIPIATVALCFTFVLVGVTKDIKHEFSRSLIYTAYKQWKCKFCSKIEFK